MSSVPSISPEHVRLMLLHQQGLLTPPARSARKADVLAAIKRMGLLQIDTISVVARSPYLVLFSRLGDYEQRWLGETHAEGKLFEYWTHAMCWLPIETLPLWKSKSEHSKRDGMGAHGRIQEWLSKNDDIVQHVMQRIRDEGALRSSDFEGEAGAPGGWWDWKREKIALEYLMYDWQLMVARRESFQRCYDLPERVVPDYQKLPEMSSEEILRELVLRASKALGIATEPWLRDYYRLRQDLTKQVVKVLLDEGELLPVKVEGLKAPAYIHTELLPLLKKAQAGKLAATHSALLSPFDPLVWHRQRSRELFGFDYTIECYTPEHKRVYGYFTLPILWRDQLVGRVDAKAHRKDGVFELRALHLEPGVKAEAQMIDDLARAIRETANWHATPMIVLTKTEPAGFRAKLGKALKG